jgi:hypothetical protein
MDRSIGDLLDSQEEEFISFCGNLSPSFFLPFDYGDAIGAMLDVQKVRDSDSPVLKESVSATERRGSELLPQTEHR